MSIAQNLTQIKASLPPHVTLVAISKTKPTTAILEAYEAGQRIFGENKIQEMTQKHQALPKDIQWHMVGHIQRNKVKYMAPFVHLIHSIDDFKLLVEINKQALRHHRIIHGLLQIKIASETSKFGMTLQDAKTLVQSKAFSELKQVRLKGLMGMATFTSDNKQIAQEFTHLKDAFETLKPYETFNFTPQIISMGMSGDYELAISCGSTMVRVGSRIFGERHQL